MTSKNFKIYLAESNMPMKNKGFTVLELIVTLTIVTILMAVAVPSLSDMLERNRVIGAAEKMKADIEWARTTAIKNNTDIIMTTTIGAADAWCYGFNDTGAACDCSNANACTVDGVTRQYDGTPFGDTTLGPIAGGYTMTLEPRGILAAAAPGAVTFTLNNASATISVTRLGRSSICSTSLSQFPNCP